MSETGPAVEGSPKPTHQVVLELMAYLIEVGMLTRSSAASIFGVSLDDFQRQVAAARQQNGT
jgi:hypothetical protein